MSQAVGQRRGQNGANGHARGSAKRRRAKSGSGEQQTRLRALVVDDHEVVHWGFKMLLTDEPWVERYLSAQDTEEAMELARRYEPHVALIDVLLGPESGPDLCRQMHDVSPGTRVLRMSGVGRISSQAARNAGA